MIFCNKNSVEYLYFCWKQILQYLITPITNELHPTFSYVICSIKRSKKRNHNNQILLKMFILLDNNYVDSTSEHWKATENLLKSQFFFSYSEKRHPLANKDWITRASFVLLEKGSFKNELRYYAYQALLSQCPIINSNYFCCITNELNQTNQMTALIIEENMESIRYPYLKWCCEAKQMGILNPHRLKYISTIHMIHPANQQTYHAFGLERNTHYSIEIGKLDCFKWIVRALGISIIEYNSEDGFVKSKNVCVINNDQRNSYPFQQLYTCIKNMGNLKVLRNRNDIWLISYGYSWRAKKREAGGYPRLTTAIGGKNKNDDSLLLLALPILERLTSQILSIYKNQILIDATRNMQFAQKLGANFNLQVSSINIFEGFDCAITSGSTGNILKPHCDVKNDWRPGFNYCSVAKALVYDTETNEKMQISLIAYTRKDVGDYIYGSNNYLTK